MTIWPPPSAQRSATRPPITLMQRLSILQPIQVLSAVRTTMPKLSLTTPVPVRFHRGQSLRRLVPPTMLLLWRRKPAMLPMLSLRQPVMPLAPLASRTSQAPWTPPAPTSHRAMPSPAPTTTPTTTAATTTRKSSASARTGPTVVAVTVTLLLLLPLVLPLPLLLLPLPPPRRPLPVPLPVPALSRSPCQ